MKKQTVKEESPPDIRGRRRRASLILYFLRGSKRFFIMSIICSLIVSVFEMVNPQIIRFTVDSVIGIEPIPERYPSLVTRLIERIGGVSYLRENLFVIAISLILIAALSVAFRYVQNVLGSKGAQSLVKNMRDKLFSHIGRLPFSWHMKNRTGDIIQRCTSDVDMVNNFVARQLTQLIRTALYIVLALVFMFGMNARLSLVALATLPVILCYSAFFHKRIGARFLECDEAEGALSSTAQENLTGVRVVRAFGRESYERDRFGRQNDSYCNMWVRLSRLLSAFWGTSDLISGLQVMLIIVLGTVFCVNGRMTTGDFIAFVSYNSMLIWPVRSLGRLISEMSKAGISIERIAYIMDSEEEHDKPDASEPDMTGDIVFDHVSFAYENTPELIHDVSFTVKSGTTLGILGGTGSGKSTLMYLLDRLYELPPECGRIKIGGVDIADIKAEWLRSHIGLVLQEPILFSRTIADNIGITGDDMTLEDIREAARIACLDDTVTSFTGGYDTIVGERGVTLSGGQKQRAAIARMLTQKAPIMIFDDSLSAVDAETDAKIRHALASAMGSATVIIISHRTSTLMSADNIIVLDRGTVRESGTHDDLIAKGGIYRQIHDLQSSFAETDCEEVIA